MKLQVQHRSYIDKEKKVSWMVGQRLALDGESGFHLSLSLSLSRNLRILHATSLCQ